MDYVKFGKTGLDVSRLCIGCMTYGISDRGRHPWTLDEEKSRPLIKQALDLGITFFDTANVYSDGTSEEIVGRALKEFVPRGDVVIATKVNGRMRPGPNGAGLSRKAILAEIDNSLRRLGTDFVDLYQIHRADPKVPIEETMEALHVETHRRRDRRAGKAIRVAGRVGTLTDECQSMTKSLSVAIIGAGISGLASAAALRRVGIESRWQHSRPIGPRADLSMEIRP
jgi:aryl-alcohol dehydrogenase-like predicted oxidoreductase